MVNCCCLQLYQKTALWAVTAMRWGFDTMTGYPKNMDEKRWLQRMVFLETVAGTQAYPRTPLIFKPIKYHPLFGNCKQHAAFMKPS